MSVLTAFIIMGLVLLGIVLLCLGVTRMEKTAKSSEYDERQQLVRGRGHRLVNMVGFAYMLLILPELVRQVEGEKTVEAYLLVFGGFMLLTMVFHVYCFINHAAMPLSSKPLAVIPCALFIGAMYLAALCNVQHWGDISLVGQTSMGVFDLMMSFFWITVAALHIFEIFRREKE